ncbi:class I adenylate-forming enzyme family protein [Zoogloea sp.]|uniref:class I adenylate-forming enzyme family protein n=1 Tax=Zoogloea sp. TaxID=49181 RepID=UPI001415A340|nr:MAG: acyl--CoA ligase [Zoogloea sp.]
MSASPIHARFRQAAGRSPGKTAVIIGDVTRSYAALACEVDALARGLLAAGVQPGDHVGVLLPNCLEFVHLLLAAAGVGAVLVPMPLSSTAGAIRKAFHTARVRHAVCWHATPEAQAAVQELPGLRLAVGGPVPGWQSLGDLCARDLPDLALPDLPPRAPYLILLTSGSTGAPKPIQLSQETKLARARSAIALYGLGEDDVVLAATPMHHSLAQRLTLIPLLTGGTSVILDRYTPTAWLDTAERHGVSFTMAVSSQLKQIIPLLDTRPAPSRLRCLVSSSATLAPETKAALFARTACAFHEIYGASEVASTTDLSVRAHPDKMQSVGTPIQDVEVAILGQDGQLQPPGQPGEIICRTPLAFDGYFGQPEATAAALWQGYFRTGDLGALDADGFLYFLGRIKDIVIVGGINVYPRDIEEVAEAFPGVAEAAAIAVDDPQLGETVGLVIAPADAGQPINQRNLLRHCASQLNDAQMPRHIFLMDRLPRNEMGKIDKPALRHQLSRPGHDS